MDTDKIQELLHTASSMPADQRPRYLEEACAGDTAMRREVEELLEMFDQAAGFLDQQALTVVMTDGEPTPEWPSDQVGPYRLERLLGRGGMGAVYLASRSDEEYQRRVAIKVMRAGVVDRDAEHRFRYERQLLAGLEHPNVARLYDGGTADDGRPYLVMEHIDGKPLDVYSDGQDLNLEGRIRLFRKVCDAVIFAHQNLLVHRDIKPSNILVTGDGTPKLLDFGIAKSLVPDASAIETAPGTKALTPAYASPEQIESRPVTTASDVYSLGVVLFELLTTARPYPVDSDSSGLALARAIADHDPIRPSRVTKLTPEQRRSLQGDLDAIILKALRKEPERRYASVALLSDDLRRYLDCEPVEAHRDSTTYRIGKFVRRHRLGVSMTAAMLLGAVLFVAALVHQSRVAAAERDRAEQALVLTEEVFKSSDPERARGAGITARQILDEGAAKIRSQAQDPWIRATLLATIGNVYVSLGLFEQAEPLHAEALALRRRVGADVALSLYQSAEAAFWKRDYTEAENLYFEALAQMSAEPTAAKGRALRGLGRSLVWLGREEEAVTYLTEAVGILRRHFNEKDNEVLSCLDGLARAASNLGDYARASDILDGLVGIRRKGGASPSLGRSISQLGIVRFLKGELLPAQQLLEESLPMLRMGGENSYVAEALGKLVLVLIRLGDYDEALSAIDEILTILPDDHPGVATAFHNRGLIFGFLGRFEEAEQQVSKALSKYRLVFGDKHESVALAHCLLGRLTLEQEKLESAELQYALCDGILQQVYPTDHPQFAFVWFGTGRINELRHGCHSATDWYRRTFELRKKKLGRDHFQTATAAGWLGRCLGELGEDEEAEVLLRRSLEVLQTQGFDPKDRRLCDAADRLRAYYSERGAEGKLQATPSCSTG